MRKGAAVACLCVTVTCWGTAFVLVKNLIVGGLSPDIMNMLRFLLSGLFLLPVLLIKRKRIESRRDLFLIAIGGLLGMSLYYFCENTGLLYISAADAAIILACSPLMLLAAQAVIYKQRTYPAKWLFGVVCVAGVVIAVGGPGHAGPQAYIGYILMVLACAVWVGYLFVNEGLIRKYGVTHATAYQTLFGALFSTLIAIPEFPQFAHIQWDTGVIVSVFALSAICNTLCYVLYNKAFITLGGLAVSAAVNMVPVVTIVTESLWMGSMMNLTQGVGAVLVVGGLTAVMLYRPKGLPSNE